MSKPVMCHVVAGYPTAEDCIRLMLGMQQADVAAIEVQIPFSDPIADGETIMAANDVALTAGMTTAGSFEPIKKARRQGLKTDIYLMSYLQKIGHFGLEEFCLEAVAAHARGLIVPDLPYDSPEADQLRGLAAHHDLRLIPVLSPGMSSQRLEAILAYKPAVLYVISGRGITGNTYAPAKQLKQLVASIKQQTNATIMVGFGIATPGDVQEVLAFADIAVVGSAVINKIENSGITATLSFIKSLVTMS